MFCCAENMRALTLIDFSSSEVFKAGVLAQLWNSAGLGHSNLPTSHVSVQELDPKSHMVIRRSDTYYISSCLTCLCLSLLSVTVLQAEARLAAKRAARAEAREIRMKELERQQKEVQVKKHPTQDTVWRWRITGSWGFYIRCHCLPHDFIMCNRGFSWFVAALWAVWTQSISCQHCLTLLSWNL